MNDLLSTIRAFLTAYNRYNASSTQGRFKEMKAAEIELMKEMDKWPVEVKKELVIKNQITLL